MHINEGKDKLALFSTKYNVLLTPLPFQFYCPRQFFYSLLHNFIIFPPQCFYSLLHNFYYFPSSMFFIPLLHNFYHFPSSMFFLFLLKLKCDCLILAFWSFRGKTIEMRRRRRRRRNNENKEEEEGKQ